MKKLRVYHVLVLILLVTTLLLTGCGKKKSSPAQTAKIHFLMPRTYEDPRYENFYNIPAGKAVKFYVFSEIPQSATESFPANADHIFTGTTRAGGGEFTFDLPNSLLGKKRYIAAIVVLKGDYDLRGKTFKQLQEDVILSDINKLHILVAVPNKLNALTDGVTISELEFVGIGQGDPVPGPGEEPGDPEDPENQIEVTINLPEVAYDLADKSRQTTMPIPANKPIDFYITTDEGEEGDPIDPEAKLVSAYTPSTGRSVTIKIAEDFEGKEVKIHALIQLEPVNKDLRGQTIAYIQDELAQRKVLYGTSQGKTDVITDGCTVPADKLMFFYGSFPEDVE